nr:ABC transporter permease [uncultured Schaedlerella sp.]
MRFFQNIKKFHGYAVYAAKAQLKSEVASSYLNWIWWILEPLCTMLIYIIVFGYIFEASEDNYTVFLFLGILMWNFFSGVVGSSVSVVKNNQDIISRVYVPKYILLISLMYQYAFRFVFGMSIEIIMMLVFRLKFGWYMISAIPFLLGFFLFTFSCSTILVHFGVYVYDLTYVVGIILNFVMFLSGIFYSIEGRIPGLYGRIAGQANPIAFFITSMRNILIYDKKVSFLWLFLWCILSLVLLTIGVWLIHRNENNYAKVV